VYVPTKAGLETDIVMPVMNGLRLAEELLRRRPSLKVVFMSGHSEDLINSQSGKSPAPELLQKPFVPNVLVRKVREMLDQSLSRVIKAAAAEPLADATSGKRAMSPK